MLNLYEKPGYKMKPHERIKWWIRREKFKWQRALWGFSSYDVMDMDHYLAELISEMLLYKAKFGFSHVEYDEELSKAWLEREKTESEYRMCKVRMALERIGEKFWELWD